MSHDKELAPRPDLVGLLARTRAGDPEAADLFFKSCMPLLRRLAHNELPPNVQSKVSEADLIQDALLHAWRALPEFECRCDNEVSAWMSRILRNCARDVVRGYRGCAKRDIAHERPNWKETAVGAAVGTRPMASPPRPDDLALHHEECERCRRAIARLSEEERRLYELKYEEDLSYPEVGRRTGMTGEAARKALGRVVRRIALEFKGR